MKTERSYNRREMLVFSFIDGVEKCSYVKGKETEGMIRFLNLPVRKKDPRMRPVDSYKERLGCDRVVCFGDGVNDISMFQSADACYAVENAVEELKAIATGVIGSNEENGVARWLEENFVPTDF